MLASLLPEGAMVLGVGMIASFFIHVILDRRRPSNADDDQYQNDDLGALLSFSPEIFFIALLPPIIFNSGLRIGALFVRHITPIVLIATVGTTVNAVCVGMLLFLVHKLGLVSNDFNPSLAELMAFGALISSTDPVSTLAVFQTKRVNPQLFYLVFGESVLNDALAIVLFESFARTVAQQKNFATIAMGLIDFMVDLVLNSVGSLCLGYASGLFTAFLFKKIEMRHHRLVEISVYLVLMYVPFLLAEILHLSGIVTILFTGVAANRYVVPNLSPITRANSDMLFRLLSHLAETSIFLELGLSVFGIIGHWNWSFIGWSLLILLIARAVNIYPIVFFFNRYILRDEKDSLLEQEVTGNTGLHWGNSDDQTPQFVRTQSDLTEVTATPLRRKDLKIRPNVAGFMWFSGLRGAVSYACVRTFPDTLGHQKDFTMTTMAIVLITVFLLGGTTELALKIFKIDTGVDEQTYMRETLREPIVSSKIRNFERNRIKQLVIRDYRGDEGLKDESALEHRLQDSSKSFTRAEATLSDEASFVTQDSLFDYGAQLSNRSI